MEILQSVLFALLLNLSSAKLVNISNTQPRRDVNGVLMDIHDGNIVQWQQGGPYYFYGMGYQNCTETTGLIPPIDCPGIYQPFGGCGFREDHLVNVYTSPDLASWTFAGDALPINARPKGIYFRPKVIFNEKNKEYVLWVNLLPEAPAPLAAYTNATYMVGVSTSPVGPFTLVNYRAAMGVGGGGDFVVFVDPKDKAAYIAYDAWDNSHTQTIERLTDDYRDSLGANHSTGPITASNHEAPMLFEREGWYYLIIGHTCCFCREGAGAQVFVAQQPMGPWTDTGLDLNPVDPSSGLAQDHVIRAQNSFVIQVLLKDGSITYIYAGDMWRSAPDKLKSHDLQYWYPLTFASNVKVTVTEANSVVAPSIASLKKVPDFTLDLA